MTRLYSIHEMESNDRSCQKDYIFRNVPRCNVMAQSTGGLMYDGIQFGEMHSSLAVNTHTDSDGCFVPVRHMVLANRYRVRSCIKTSGQSAVLVEAEDYFHERLAVVIKVMHNSYLAVGLKEVQTLRKINSMDPKRITHTVHLLNSFRFKDHICLVFPLLNPLPLTDIIADKFCHENEILSAIRKISLQLLSAIAYLRSLNIIHADIKPDNILLEQDGDINTVTLIDFGNAIHHHAHSEASEASLYYTDFELQTQPYRAPEVHLGLPFGMEVDMWSLGCVLLELLTGQLTFSGNDRVDSLKKMVSALGPLPADMCRQGKFYHEVESVVTMTHSMHKVESGALRLMSAFPQVNDYEYFSFLSGLLVYHPAKRMTPWEALQHPFMAPLICIPHFLAGDRGLIRKSDYNFKQNISTNVQQRLHPSTFDLSRSGTSDQILLGHSNVAFVEPLGHASRIGKEEDSQQHNNYKNNRCVTQGSDNTFISSSGRRDTYSDNVCRARRYASPDGRRYASPDGRGYDSPDGRRYASPDGRRYASPDGRRYASPDVNELEMSAPVKHGPLDYNSTLSNHSYNRGSAWGKSRLSHGFKEDQIKSSRDMFINQPKSAVVQNTCYRKRNSAHRNTSDCQPVRQLSGSSAQKNTSGVQPVIKESPHAGISDVQPVKQSPQAGISDVRPVKQSPQAGISDVQPVKQSPQAGISDVRPVKESPRAGISDVQPVKQSPHGGISDVRPVKESPHGGISDVRPVKESPHGGISDVQPVKQSPHGGISDVRPVKESPHGGISDVHLTNQTRSSNDHRTVGDDLINTEPSLLKEFPGSDTCHMSQSPQTGDPCDTKCTAGSSHRPAIIIKDLSEFSAPSIIKDLSEFSAPSIIKDLSEFSAPSNTKCTAESSHRPAIIIKVLGEFSAPSIIKDFREFSAPSNTKCTAGSSHRPDIIIKDVSEFSDPSNIKKTLPFKRRDTSFPENGSDTSVFNQPFRTEPFRGINSSQKSGNDELLNPCNHILTQDKFTKDQPCRDHLVHSPTKHYSQVQEKYLFGRKSCPTDQSNSFVTSNVVDKRDNPIKRRRCSFLQNCYRQDYEIVYKNGSITETEAEVSGVNNLVSFSSGRSSATGRKTDVAEEGNPKRFQGQSLYLGQTTLSADTDQIKVDVGHSEKTDLDENFNQNVDVAYSEKTDFDENFNKNVGVAYSEKTDFDENFNQNVDVAYSEKTDFDENFNKNGQIKTYFHKAKAVLKQSLDQEVLLHRDDASMKVDDVSMKVDDVSMKVDDASMKVDDVSMKVDDAIMKVDDASMKVDDANMKVDDADSVLSKECPGSAADGISKVKIVLPTRRELAGVVDNCLHIPSTREHGRVVELIKDVQPVPSTVLSDIVVSNVACIFNISPISNVACKSSHSTVHEGSPITHSQKRLITIASRKNSFAIASRKSSLAIASRKSSFAIDSQKGLNVTDSLKSPPADVSQKSLPAAVSQKSLPAAVNKKSLPAADNKKSLPAADSQKSSPATVSLHKSQTKVNHIRGSVDQQLRSIHKEMGTTKRTNTNVKLKPRATKKDKRCEEYLRKLEAISIDVSAGQITEDGINEIEVRVDLPSPLVDVNALLKPSDTQRGSDLVSNGHFRFNRSGRELLLGQVCSKHTAKKPERRGIQQRNVSDKVVNTSRLLRVKSVKRALNFHSNTSEDSLCKKKYIDAKMERSLLSSKVPASSSQSKTYQDHDKAAGGDLPLSNIKSSEGGDLPLSNIKSSGIIRKASRQFLHLLSTSIHHQHSSDPYEFIASPAKPKPTTSYMKSRQTRTARRRSSKFRATACNINNDNNNCAVKMSCDVVSKPNINIRELVHKKSRHMFPNMNLLDLDNTRLFNNLTCKSLLQNEEDMTSQVQLTQNDLPGMVWRSELTATKRGKLLSSHKSKKISTSREQQSREIFERIDPVLMSPIVEGIDPVLISPIVEGIDPVLMSPIVEGIDPILMSPIVEGIDPVLMSPNDQSKPAFTSTLPSTQNACLEAVQDSTNSIVNNCDKIGGCCVCGGTSLDHSCLEKTISRKRRCVQTEESQKHESSLEQILLSPIMSPDNNESTNYHLSTVDFLHSPRLDLVSPGCVDEETCSDEEVLILQVSPCCVDEETCSDEEADLYRLQRFSSLMSRVETREREIRKYFFWIERVHNLYRCSEQIC